MDGNKKLVTAAEKTIPATVKRASRWALYNACFTLGHAVTYALLQSSFALRCVQWTDAKAAQESALCLWMLRCAVLQVAAAALALHLSCRRRWVRRALAYLALVVAFVAHCMYVAAVRLLLAADCPGSQDLVHRVHRLLPRGDLLCFLGLLLGGDN